MPILGAHMSIAGGYHKSVVAASEAGCDCVQIFTKNNNQWRAVPITDEDVQQFREALQTYNIRHPIAHASYLLNLASPDDALWSKSLDAFVLEMQRAERLGLDALVIHPGSYTSSSEDEGLQRIVEAVDEMHRQTTGFRVRCLLETTAGQGTNLGYRFEQLATILNGVEQSERLGICFDTCHVFAAGYGLIERREYLATMREFDKIVGTRRIEAFHLNDSKRERGSRVDRHEHIGLGQLGLEPFRHLLKDRRFRTTPMYLETAKGEHEGQDWDVINLRQLRALLA
jgi:deoxyribonuclease-4